MRKEIIKANAHNSNVHLQIKTKNRLKQERILFFLIGVKWF